MITLEKAEELLLQLNYVGLEADNSEEIVSGIRKYFHDRKYAEECAERAAKLVEMHNNAKLAKYFSYQSVDGYLTHAIPTAEDLLNQILDAGDLRVILSSWNNRIKRRSAVCGYRTGKTSGVLMPHELAFEQEEQKINQVYDKTYYSKCRKCETIVNRELLAQKVED